nr:hypothetical protein [Bacteroidota bacterium]
MKQGTQTARHEEVAPLAIQKRCSAPVIFVALAHSVFIKGAAHRNIRNCMNGLPDP